MDYDTPRFKSSEVARAAGIEINSFRTYFKRGQFKFEGLNQRAAEMHGAAHLWSLRDAMGFAVAGELIRAGADPAKAFNAAMWGFAHVGSGVSHPPIPGEPPMRDPGELWDAREVGFTAMAFFPATGADRVFPFRHQLSMSDAMYDPRTRARAPSIILFLNDIEHRVFAALGVNASEAAQ